MAYSDFKLLEVQQKFGVTIEESMDLFHTVPESELPKTLSSILTRYLPLALNLNTEKARSELLIAPFLTEFKLLHADTISLFSGLEFNVNEAQGLKGRCDYILSSNSQQLVLTAPICVLVEAKNENIVGGLGQCLAEMIAAQQFNLEQNHPRERVYGIVTTGIQWRFLQLERQLATVDSVEYSIQNPEKIFGILEHIVL
jgi:hypothetical protein